MRTLTADDRALVEFMAEFTHDPYGHVLATYPWGKPGTELAEQAGPRDWQREYLIDIGKKLVEKKTDPHRVIQEAVCSGHDIGKSALVSWLIKWGLDTCADTRCMITANTEAQLRTKTWPELAKWHRLSIAKHFFVFTDTALFSADAEHKKTWRADMVTWSEHNSEAFAGLHNLGKRLVLIFDEASKIPKIIWEVASGALTDEHTEIIWAVFGNPTRNTGPFRECFGKFRHRWGNRQIDSRQVEGTNKKLFKEWIEDHGEDSDWVRVRVRGMFPRGSDLQYIDGERVLAAQRREARHNYGDPLLMSLDIARGGEDNCVIRFRRGLDARSVPPIRIPGSAVRDSMVLVAKVVDLIELHKPDAFFYDETGVGGPVGDRIRQMGYSVIGVPFGGESPDPHCANMRAYMWARMRDALGDGLAIDDSTLLEQDLTGPEFGHNKRDQLLLEAKEHMKARGLASPDDGDALAMLFAYPIAPVFGLGSQNSGKTRSDWNPIAKKRR